MEPYVVILDRSGFGLVVFISVKELVNYKKKKPNIICRVSAKLRGRKLFGATGSKQRNCLYVVGGEDVSRKTCLPTASRYNPSDDSWQELPPMATPRKNCGVGLVADQLLCVTGGEKSDGRATKICESFDLDKEKWVKGYAGVLPAPRAEHACVAKDNQLFLCGGKNRGSPQKNLWVLEDYQWHHLDDNYPAEMNTATAKHGMLASDDSLFFIGGVIDSGESQEASASLSSFKLVVGATETEEGPLHSDLISPWRWDYPDMNKARCNAAACLIGGVMFLFGGTGQKDESIREVECFDLKQNRWEVCFSLPSVEDYKNVTCVILDFDPSGCVFSEETERGRPEVETPEQWVLW
ncbi:hypothetical protein CAPTEDRAFT_220148 [Capitella teleta]|uniref:BACK domain-containing protein n=1 Tax=Capitella teleta TaxID=283909 RepID=R7UTG6_CAPTE|nr:hypothetical protein CAPTEDRAFT_220148 [Capitella teleta]|eukprot:ELU06676.1 hypothetical protein CAPTEDRAFT_220148 [Capitella teleta]